MIASSSESTAATAVNGANSSSGTGGGGRQADDRRLDVEAAVHAAVGQPLATDEDGAVAARLGDRGLVSVHGLLVDDRAEPVLARRSGSPTMSASVFSTSRRTSSSWTGRST